MKDGMVGIQEKEEEWVSMSFVLSVVVMIVVAVVAVVFSPSVALAQIVEPVMVYTDASQYGPGDTVVIEGEVKEILQGFPITLQLWAANGDRVTVEQLEVDAATRSFRHSVEAGSSTLWESYGTYRIKVLYGTESRTAETSFEYLLGGRQATGIPFEDVEEEKGSSSSPGTLTVSVPHTHYKTGDPLVISGTADPNLTREIKLAGVPEPIEQFVGVTLQVVDSAGNRVAIAQFDELPSDGFYTETFHRDWEMPGLYTVKVSQGYERAEDYFWFNYDEGEDLPEWPQEEEEEDHSIPEATNIVKIPAGTAAPGCEETYQCYRPYHVVVNVGEEVTWENADTAAHTVTSGGPSQGPDGDFDSSLFVPGGKFSRVFEESGKYDYFCMVHPWMTGLVDVRGGVTDTADEGVEDPPRAPTKDVVEELKQENLELKRENMALKSRINKMQSEIDQLEDLIVNALKEIYEWIPKSS